MPVHSVPSVQDQEELMKRMHDAYEIATHLRATEITSVEGVDEIFYLAARLATAASDITGYINMLVNVEHYYIDPTPYTIQPADRKFRTQVSLKDLA